VNQADESRRADWEQVFREKFTALRDAQERLVRTEITYRDGKQRHRLRGSVKAELLAAIEVQQTEVANATEDLAELRERARVEGVPGGWIDAVEEELSSPASLN
jgi:hypothetical protein